MPLPLANLSLDDRRWADLVEEGRALIPRHAPGWTDHNLSDPGITLIELLAWLTEQSTYRLNRVPERHRRKFLSLIGYTPRPPRPALAVLAVPGWTLPAIVIPAGFEFETEDPEGLTVAFRTLQELTVATVSLAAVQVDPGGGVLADRSRHWRDGLPVAVLGEDPRPGAALYLGFEQIPTETPVSLALHFTGGTTGSDARLAIIEEAAEQRATERPVLPAIHCDGTSPAREPVLPPHHSARIIWEVLTDLNQAGIETWLPLEPMSNGARPEPGQVWDDTRSLTLDGIVELNLPAATQKESIGSVTTPHYWVRCRLEAGALDAAPLLMDLAINAVRAEQALPIENRYVISETATMEFDVPEPTAGDLVRLRMTLDATAAIAGLRALDPTASDAQDHPDLRWLDYCAPSSIGPGWLTLDIAHIGTGTGLPGQALTLPQAPVQQSSLLVYTHLEDAWTSWTRRDDLDASRRTDRHFVLDAATGAVRFGDGERGRVPEAGALVFASWRSTQAEAGILKAGSSFRPTTSSRNALAGLSEEEADRLDRLTVNPVNTCCGAATETVAQATGRAVETLHAHERLLGIAQGHKQRTLDQVAGAEVRAIAAPTRAVSLLDLERLALEVPGTRVARARAWSSLHPAYPCLTAPGVVTVVVLPELPRGRPEPSPGLIAAVRCFLERRRMVATRLEVVGPRYLEVGVIADVRTKALVDAARVRDDILTALDAFLDPLTGGPAGLGWPFGRSVFRSEVLQLIDGVQGVDHVLSLRLIAAGAEPSCGNLNLCPTWLVAPVQHRIRVNPAADVLPDTGPIRPVCPPEPAGDSPS